MMEQRNAALPGREAGEPDEARLRQKIARLEALRRLLLVLASLLMIGGYVSAVKPVLYACVVPLAAAIPVTYAIKHLEEKLRP